MFKINVCVHLHAKVAHMHLSSHLFKSVSSYLDSVFLLLPSPYLIDLTFLESSTHPVKYLFPPLDYESSLHPPTESLFSLIQGRSDLLPLEFLWNGPLPGPLQIKSEGKQPDNLKD